MPNWKKVITSGSSAILNNIIASGNISVYSNVNITGSLIISSSTLSPNKAALEIHPSGSSKQYGILITGSTFQGIPLALIQNSGEGEFIYGKGKDGEESFRLRQAKGGAGTFHLYSSQSHDRQVETHHFVDPLQGEPSYVNYTEDSRSVYFGIGIAVPQTHLHVSGNISASGFIRSLGHIEVGGDLLGKSASGVDFGIISASSTELTVAGDISASGDIFLGGGVSNYKSINFGDPAEDDAGRIYYQHSDDLMTIKTGGYERLRISSSGGTTSPYTVVGIGNNTPTKTLTVKGDISASGDFFVGSTTGAYISGSQGNLELSGSGIGELTVDHRHFDTGSSTVSAAGGAIGDTFKFGDSSGLTPGLCFFLESDGTWDKTDANDGGKTSGSIAIATNASALNGLCMRGIVKLSHNPGGNIGAPLYLSAASIGQLTSTVPGTGDFVRVVGHNLDTGGLIFFNPGDVTIEVA